ncbi:MAG: glycosyltransferase family 4 protein [Xanthobacteraceae bacterium]
MKHATSQELYIWRENGRTRPALERTDLLGERRRILRVTMLGMRGFPDVQGGVERHAEKLACALAELGCRVEAIARSCHLAKGNTTWRNVRIIRIWAPHVKGFEAFVHTFLGVVRAAFSRPDVLHIHAIGPAIFTPLARALGLRVVVTYHSLNYEHKKWGHVARFVLRLGEWAGMAFANGRIAVSEGLAQHMERRYRVPVNAIPNGIGTPLRVRSTAFLEACGLVQNGYALTVARIDETKCQLDLIAAYARLREPTWKLALVGGADHSSRYARAVAEAARKTPGVVLLGHQTAEHLAELYTHAHLFVLPSSHEGQPIAVLEAASFGLPVLLSDIPAHRELGLSRASYFKAGDIASLTEHLASLFAAPVIERFDATERARLAARHDWHNIAQRTLAVYFDTLSGAKSGGLADAPSARKMRELS